MKLCTKYTQKWDSHLGNTERQGPFLHTLQLTNDREKERERKRHWKETQKRRKRRGAAHSSVTQHGPISTFTPFSTTVTFQAIDQWIRWLAASFKLMPIAPFNCFNSYATPIDFHWVLHLKLLQPNSSSIHRLQLHKGNANLHITNKRNQISSVSSSHSN